MNKLKGLLGPMGLTALLLLLVTVVIAPEAGFRSMAFAGESGWNNVTILYINDVKGKIDPCG
jgi:hypothetical protein